MNVKIKKCSHKPQLVFNINNISYYAADREHAFEFDGDAIINLTGIPNIPISIIPSLIPHYEIPFQEVLVAWPDFGIPRVKDSFWQAIHSMAEHCSSINYTFSNWWAPWRNLDTLGNEKRLEV